MKSEKCKGSVLFLFCLSNFECRQLSISRHAVKRPSLTACVQDEKEMEVNGSAALVVIMKVRHEDKTLTDPSTKTEEMILLSLHCFFSFPWSFVMRMVVTC